MAEAIAHIILPEIEFFSRGVSVFGECPASHNAIKAVSAFGGDLSAHKSVQVSEQDLKDADLVLAMTSSHLHTLFAIYPKYADKCFTVAEYAGGDSDIQDPFGASYEVYKQCAEQILNYLQKAVFIGKI
jgi:protein-tyrosine-phosphatase